MNLPVGDRGVALSQLRCPTCGQSFNLTSRRDDELDEFEPAKIKPMRPFYLICMRGHQWSIKTLWRMTGHEDQVLLGDFLGGG